MATPRVSWDQYFFAITQVVSTRATCNRAAIGAVLVKHKRVIGSGYNGVPEGQEHCPDTAEHLALDHCRATVHAERNALTNALVPVHGATLYVYGPRKVCPDCRDALVLAGVTDIRVEHGPAGATLEAVLDDVRQWQVETFPQATPQSISSALFLALAFGSLDFLAGQVWGKLLVTLVTVAVLWLWRGRDLPQPDRACAHG